MIVIDEVPMEIDPFMQPEVELMGSIAKIIEQLSKAIDQYHLSEDAHNYLTTLQTKLNENQRMSKAATIPYIPRNH